MTKFTAKQAGSTFILKADGVEFARVHDESDFSGWEVCMLKKGGYQWPCFDHLALSRDSAFAAAKRMFIDARTAAEVVDGWAEIGRHIPGNTPPRTRMSRAANGLS